MRLILVYISGILAASYYPADLFITLIVLLILSVLYLVAWMPDFSWLNPIGLLLIFLAGYSNLLLEVAHQRQVNQSVDAHEPLKGYTARIQKVYHPFSCIAWITHIKDDVGWHNSSTSIQLYFSKKSNYKPKKGDTLLIRGTPIRILPSQTMQPADPALHSRSTHRHVLKQMGQDFIFLPPLHQNNKWVKRITAWCSHTLQKQLQDKYVLALVAALLWGAKDRLSPALQKAYADTGTIHVLAISGLHVGMFYLLIKAIFKYTFRNIGCLIVSELFTL